MYPVRDGRWSVKNNPTLTWTGCGSSPGSRWSSTTRSLWGSRRKTFSGQVDWFNLLNGNAVFSQVSAVGASLGQIQTTLQGRLTRLAFQMKW